MTLYEGFDAYFSALFQGSTDFGRYKEDDRDYYYGTIIKKYFPDMELQEFTGEILLDGFKAMRRNYMVKDTLERVMRILEQGFQYLCEAEGQATNLIKINKKEIREIIGCCPLNREERKQILSKLPFLNFPNLFGFVIYTGIKPEKATALTRGSIYLSASECYADQVLVGVDKDGRPLMKKIMKGTTRVGLSERAKHYLTEEEKKQALYRQRAEEAWANPEDLVFTDAFGRPVTKELIREDNETLRILTGIEGLTLERLSKMYMTFLKDAGAV